MTPGRAAQGPATAAPLGSASAGALALLGCVAAALALGVVGFGMARGFFGIAGGAESETHRTWLPGALLLARTGGVAVLIGALAAALGFPAGWAMRRVSGAWGALLVAPLLLPSYLVYASWSLLRAPGTALGDVLFRAGGPLLLQRVSVAQAIGGLALWASPLAALILAAKARGISNDALDSLRMEGVRGFALVRPVWRAMRGGVCAATGAVALLMVGSAVPLHLSAAPTYAIEVWRRLDETGGARSAWVTAAPLIGAAVIAAIWLGRIAAKGGERRIEARSPAGGARDARVSRGWLLAAALVWLAGVAAPLALFLANLKDARSLGRFWHDAGSATAQSAAAGAAVGVIACVIASATCAGFGAARGSRARRIAVGGLVAWAALGLTPGVLIGASVARAATAPGLGWMTEGLTGIVVAHVARFGFVAALAGWWLASLEPEESREQRALAGGGAGSWWRGAGRAGAAGFVAAGVAAGTLSFHEIESAALVSAPGRDTLPRHMLAMLHYLRVEELNAGASQVMAIGLLGSVAAALLLWRARRGLSVGGVGRAMSLLIVVGAAALIPGCAKATARDGRGRALEVKGVFGEAGRAPGQFVYPRCIEFAPAPGDKGGTLWVIDKTARVQRLSLTGESLGGWTMPAFENGKPTGVGVGGDGLIYVPDTHYQRVMVFTPGGEQVASFGEYGMAPGQFIYPTDVVPIVNAAGAPGTIDRIYVSEYGGNDRISCFDADHKFLFAFGREGTSDSPGQIEFSRPQSIAWDAKRARLIVTDAGNHRLGAFTGEGGLIKWIGKRDAALGPVAGEPTVGAAAVFNYPYGLALLADGTALVSEFGGGRVQRVDIDAGTCIAVYGGPGRGRGEFAYPWGVAAGAVSGAEQWVYVLDSGNNRVQAFTVGLAPAGGAD